MELVHLPEYAPEDMDRPDPDVVVDPSAAELKTRHKLGFHRVRQYRPDQIPEFKHGRVKRRRQCPYCHFRNHHMLSVCPRCHNCMACGSYNPEASSGNCYVCGNSYGSKTPEVPTIGVGQ